MNKMIDYQWIDTNEQLAEVCQKAIGKTAVALDTEFIRIRSFYPKLGLIQLFDGEQTSLIDPLAITDFTPFIELLRAPTMKVFHACSEDLEVFKHAFGMLPTPMLDTQIMAGFAGLGVSLGFAKLVEQYAEVVLDKAAARTDWLARPLSAEQCRYAAADVYYLLPVYQQLLARLRENDWFEAVQQECESLSAKRLKEVDVSTLYRDIGNAWQLNPQQLAVLQVLAKWRWEEAKKRDLALNFVVKEQSLLQIAKNQPKHTASLLEFMHPNEVRIHGKKILLLVEQGLAVEPQNYPEPLSRGYEDPNYKRFLKQAQVMLPKVQPENLATEMFTGKRQLTQLFSWLKNGKPPEKLPELLQGWREPYGKKLLDGLQAVGFG